MKVGEDLIDLYVRILRTTQTVYCVDVWQEDGEICVKHNYRSGGDFIYCYKVKEDHIDFAGFGKGSFYKEGWRRY